MGSCPPGEAGPAPRVVTRTDQGGPTGQCSGCAMNEGRHCSEACGIAHEKGVEAAHQIDALQGGMLEKVAEMVEACCCGETLGDGSSGSEVVERLADC